MTDTGAAATAEPSLSERSDGARRRLEPDERREQILQCAIEMFGERPYAAVSTADLASRAGVARGLINHYFGTKRDLYLAVVRRMVTLPPDAARPAFTGTIRERADLSVRWLLDMLVEHGATWVAVVGAEGIGDDPELQRILDEADDSAAEWVLRGVGAAHDSEAMRAVVRSYGAMVKYAGREWIRRNSLTRHQVEVLLVESLIALAENVVPQVGDQRA